MNKDKMKEKEQRLLCELLSQIGLFSNEIDIFMKILEKKDFLKLQRILKLHREHILNQIHEKEKLICNLDFLSYQLKKKGEMKNENETRSR